MTFAVFFLIVMPISWKLRPHPTPWKLFILAASYVFYAWWDWRFLGLIIASTIGNEVAALAISRASDDRGRKIALTCGVIFDLGLLGFFKYYEFFSESLVSLLSHLHIQPTGLLLKVTLPVAISFFTFCGLSYIIDVYRGTLRPASLLEVAVYLSFFPHLVAGPIVRGSELLPQLREQPDPDALDATRAARLIGRGLIKKMIVANYLAQALTDPVFGSPRSYKSWDLLIAAYAYSVQIYADFSGYTDIAIGVALLLGVKFPPNFDRPYTAATLQDFWRRWHMTLSRWLRDYLYIPLGGSRGGRRAMYRNLMITMVLGGLWHGASWNFVLWGALHGVGLVVERRWVESRERPKHARMPTLERMRTTLGLETSHGDVPIVDVDDSNVEYPNPAKPWISRLIVFHFVTFAWIFFATNSLNDAFQYIGRLFTAWGSTVGLKPLVLLVIIAALMAQFVPTRVGALLEWRASNLPPIVQGLAFGVLLLVCNVLGPQGVAPFIYFRF